MVWVLTTVDTILTTVSRDCNETGSMMRNLTVCLAVMLHEISSHRVDLHGKLAGGRNDNCSSTVSGHEFGSVQQLQ